MNEIDDVKLNGHKFKRLPGNANFSFKNITLLNWLKIWEMKAFVFQQARLCGGRRKTVAGYYGYKCSERVCLWNSKNNYIT